MKSDMEFPKLYTGSLINVANLSIIPENPENMTVLRNRVGALCLGLFQLLNMWLSVQK